MSTQFPDLFAKLAAPFDPQEVRVRSQAGRQLHYITARTAMNRLDDVLGPENWWDEYSPGESSVLCRLTVRLPDGQELTKADAGGYAGMADSGDDDKSGFSDAFKRACSKFGVARYLYRDGVPSFVSDRQPEEGPAPAPPARRAPPSNGNGHAPDGHGRRRGGDERERGDKPPSTGRGLWAWAKENGERNRVDLAGYLTRWAKLQDFPGRVAEWGPGQVEAGYAEAVRKLQSIGRGSSEAYEEALASA